MPVAGRKPKPDGQKRNRMPPVHDWTEVPNLPYSGKRPTLPKTRGRLIKMTGAAERYDDVPVHAMTRRWWKAVSSMPHCALWTDTDWGFALSTAIVADRFYYGEPAAAGELRQREKLLGTTLDSRRDLRIRYVDPTTVDATNDSAGAEVVSINYRRMVAGGDA